MPRGNRIPIPWKHRWRRFRYSALPVLCFMLSSSFTLWLWNKQSQMPNAVGEVEWKRIPVAAETAGRLLKVKLPEGLDLSRLTDLTNLTDLAQSLDSSEKFGDDWTLFDKVQAGEIIARLDHRLAKAQLKTLTLAVGRLRKDVLSTAAQIRVDESDRQVDQHRLRLDHDRQAIQLMAEANQTKLEMLDRRTQLAVAKIELERRALHVRLLQPQYEKKAVSHVEFLVEVQKVYEEAKATFDESSKALQEAEAQALKAEQQLQRHVANYPEVQLADEAALLAPVRAAVDEQLGLVGELEVEINSLVLRAPIGGTICAIYYRPGQFVPAGEPIVMIGTEDSRYAISYVRQEQRYRPLVGEQVDVRVRLPGSPPQVAVIEQVGPQFQEIPPHQCRDPMRLEWGLPVRILLPGELSVIPGELIDVTFKPWTRNKAG